LSCFFFQLKRSTVTINHPVLALRLELDSFGFGFELESMIVVGVEFSNVGPSVKRNFWPVIVCQCFCFSV